MLSLSDSATLTVSLQIASSQPLMMTTGCSAADHPKVAQQLDAGVLAE
jgi:hypothetical protein